MHEILCCFHQPALHSVRFEIKETVGVDKARLAACARATKTKNSFAALAAIIDLVGFL
jgi:hypothetical protein